MTDPVLKKYLTEESTHCQESDQSQQKLSDSSPKGQSIKSICDFCLKESQYLINIIIYIYFKNSESLILCGIHYVADSNFSLFFLVTVANSVVSPVYVTKLYIKKNATRGWGGGVDKEFVTTNINVLNMFKSAQDYG